MPYWHSAFVITGLAGCAEWLSTVQVAGDRAQLVALTGCIPTIARQQAVAVGWRRLARPHRGGAGWAPARTTQSVMRVQVLCRVRVMHAACSAAQLVSTHLVHALVSPPADHQPWAQTTALPAAYPKPGFGRHARMSSNPMPAGVGIGDSFEVASRKMEALYVSCALAVPMLGGQVRQGMALRP